MCEMISEEAIEEQRDFAEEREKRWLRDMRRMDYSDFMPTVTMHELYESVYQGKPAVVEGLLYTGTYLFVGAPKIGKSFLMAQLAYHISTGTPIWDYPVKQGTVLYLALEDDFRRLQSRLYRMFGLEYSENLYFSIYARSIKAGLLNQLKDFMCEHPDTRLIIIDTLQKVRELSGETYSYGSDYEIIGQMKEFADEYGLCLLLVHHTRKQQADDKFDMISGTNGLLGAADGAFLLHKEKRTSNAAILDISGRDQQDQRLYLIRNEKTLTWDLDRAETELWAEPIDPIIEQVAKLVTAEKPVWQGTATELVEQLKLDMKPHFLTMKMNIHIGRLLNDYGIQYSTNRTHAGRRIILSYVITG